MPQWGMSMSPDAFEQKARNLARLNGLTEKRAKELLARTGDIIELAEDGRMIVRDEDRREIARLIFRRGQ
jgi:hypothetical protein